MPDTPLTLQDPDIGAVANDGLGDKLRNYGLKVIANNALVRQAIDALADAIGVDINDDELTSANVGIDGKSVLEVLEATAAGTFSGLTDTPTSTALAAAEGATLVVGATGNIELVLPPLSIDSFSEPSAATVEVGTTVTDPVFTASYTNGPPESATMADNQATGTQTIAGPAFDSHTYVASYTSTTVNELVRWTLSATKNGVTETRTHDMRFGAKHYYGAAAIPGTLDEAFILSLTDTLDTNLAHSFTVNAGTGEYIWSATRQDFGDALYEFGGFEEPFDQQSVVNVTSNGVTVAYVLRRTPNPGLGSTTVTVTEA